MLRVIEIIGGTSVDGPGLRTSIYFAGCNHQCPGCHNPQSWSFDAGDDMSVDEILYAIDKEGFNVTFTGGDPIYQLDNLIELAKRIFEKGYTIWLYTGYTMAQLETIPGFSRLRPYIEAIVDGQFVEKLRDTGLKFRGSSNQNIIYLN